MRYVHFVSYNKNSKIPTLILNSSNNMYNCVRCEISGYGTELYAKVKGINKQETFKELLKRKCYSQNKETMEISPINLLANVEIRDKCIEDY